MKKITLIFHFVLIVQVSGSFLDVFQGAVHSVQNSFGKLITDVVTDVKETVDCTILAIEHVLSLSPDATALYNEKCGSGNNSTTTTTKDNIAPILEISISNNEDYLNKLLPKDIDSRINDTIMRIFHGYNPHDKLADVERELAKETERLAGISNLVKQELDKLSHEFHINFISQQQNTTKPSVDLILEELRLLEAIEHNLRNSSEAHEIHKVVENVLHKLDAIEASEVSENAKVEKILKDLENNSNGTYKDLRKRLEDWKKDEDRHLDLIRKNIEQHEKSPEHSEYLEINKVNSVPGSQLKSAINNTNNTNAQELNNSTRTEKPDNIHEYSIGNNITISTVTPFNVSFTTSRNVSTILPELASTELAPVNTTNNIRNVSIDVIPQSSDKPILSTSRSTPKIELKPMTNIITASNTTNPGLLRARSLYNSEPLTSMMTTTPVRSVPMTILLNSLKELSTKSPSPVHQTPVKTYNSEFSTKLNDDDKSIKATIPSIQTSLSSKNLKYTTPATSNAAIRTTEQIIPKVTHKQTSTTQINHVFKGTAPVSITTSSYDNENNNNSVITGIMSPLPAHRTSVKTYNLESSSKSKHNDKIIKDTVPISKPLSSMMTTTPVRVSSTTILLNSTKELSAKSPSTAHQTSVKTYNSEYSTKLNDNDKSNKATVPSIQTSLLSKVLTSTTPETTNSAIRTEQIIPKVTHKQFTTKQINDVLKITTPVSITTNSYANKDNHKSTITETMLTTDSPTTVAMVTNVLNRDLKFSNAALTTNAPSTKQEMITEIDHPITTTSPVTTLTTDYTTQRSHLHEQTSTTTITAQSTVTDSQIQDTSVKPTTTLKSLNTSKKPAITTPSLDVFLKYVDRIITTTPISTTKSKKLPLTHRDLIDPWLKQLHSGASPEFINNNSIAPLNNKFATRPYSNPLMSANKGVPSLVGLNPPKPSYSMNAKNKVLPGIISLPLRSFFSPDTHVPFHKKHNAPRPYSKLNKNNTPVLNREFSRSPRLLPQRKNHEHEGSILNNGRHPPKHDNFDDPAYDEFFHIPSKNAEHERALREARKLIEDSQLAHRVMANILNKKNKGRSAFNLPSSLNVGK